MRRVTVCASLLVMMSFSVLWSQETVQPRKQRVSPKLLREAMALPEYRAQAPGSKQSSQLDDVTQLAEKLKKSGDNDGADLLRQFVVAHQQLMKHNGLHATAADEEIELQFTVIEVKAADVSSDSVLRDANSAERASDKQAALAQLLAAKKANPIVTPISITTKANQVVHFTESGELPLSLSSSVESSKKSAAGSGIVLNVLPTLGETKNLRLQTAFEFHHKASGHSGPKHEPKEVGLPVETIAEVDFGESIVISHPRPMEGHFCFLVIAATRAN